MGNIKSPPPTNFKTDIIEPDHIWLRQIQITCQEIKLIIELKKEQQAKQNRYSSKVNRLKHTFSVKKTVDVCCYMDGHLRKTGDFGCSMDV